ncbi:MAG: response regulator [Puniceicoccaceae bacterium]
MMNEDSDSKSSILIADDNLENLKVLSTALIGFGYEVRIATNGRKALESAFIKAPDLILLDIHMPELDGYETCREFKKDLRTRDIPIIFVSALDEPFNKVKAFRQGAIDYLTKPIEMEEVRARVEVHLLLRQKIKELEDFNRIMVEREMRMIELKNEVNALSRELGRHEPYPEARMEVS